MLHIEVIKEVILHYDTILYSNSSTCFMYIYFEFIWNDEYDHEYTIWYVD